MSVALVRVAYALARSFYAVVTLLLIWGALIWTPLGTLLAAALLLHLVTKIEEVGFLERGCRYLRTHRPPPRPGRLFAHREDLHSVIFLALAVADYLSAFYLYLHFDELGLGGTWSRVFFVLGVGTMLGWVAGVNLGVVFHNHLHRGSFRNPHLNRWIGRLWTVPSGWPSYFWLYKHTVVHHKHVGKPRDWVQPRIADDGGYESIYRYIFFHWPTRYARHLWDEFTGPNQRRNRRALTEVAIFFPFWIAPLLIDPIMGLGLWLYPHWFGSAFILGTGMYTQHFGGTTEKEHSGSTTFLSEFFNLTMFNVGYHTEHHANPSVHWSELPALHARLRDELIEGGAHVVAYGSYHAGSLLSSLSDPRGAAAEFRKQHPEYVAVPQARELAEAREGARS